jgi:hypothetical protein
LVEYFCFRYAFSANSIAFFAGGAAKAGVKSFGAIRGRQFDCRSLVD